MRWALLLLVACGGSGDASVDAFRWADKGRLDQAAASVTRCAHVAPDDERYFCSDLLGGIRMRQGYFTEAAIAYREAFAIRDRIAKREGYGTPNADSLHQWGYALLRTGHPLEARPVLERARLVATAPDEQLILAAIDLELAEIATKENNPTAAASLEAEARTHACQTDEIQYFGKIEWLHTRYFPKDVWLAVAGACASPAEADQLRARAAMLPP
jgi:hypothetical protein